MTTLPNGKTLAEVHEAASRCSPVNWVVKRNRVTFAIRDFSGRYIAEDVRSEWLAEFIAACDPGTVRAIIESHERMRAALERIAELENDCEHQRFQLAEKLATVRAVEAARIIQAAKDVRAETFKRCADRMEGVLSWCLVQASSKVLEMVKEEIAWLRGAAKEASQ